MTFEKLRLSLGFCLSLVSMNIQGKDMTQYKKPSESELKQKLSPEQLESLYLYVSARAKKKYKEQ